jgi:hypothetical protein
MKRRTQVDRNKELQDNARLLRAWKAFHAEELDTAMNGTHGSTIARLMEILRALDLRSASMLIDFVKARNWQAIDANTELVVLHEVGCAITKLRTRNHLEPIDDPLPGERDNVFQVIKAILFPLQAAPTGANAGHMRPMKPLNEGTRS